MKKKNWCVLVYEFPQEIPDVMAATANKAELLVVNSFFAGSYDNISRVEVMRHCDCGHDNDRDDDKCVECGRRL